MKNIKVEILDHNLNGTPLFLAKLTQRGSQITSMDDLLNLYKDNLHRVPSIGFMKLPHSTIFRMCHLLLGYFMIKYKYNDLQGDWLHARTKNVCHF